MASRKTAARKVRAKKATAKKVAPKKVAAKAPSAKQQLDAMIAKLDRRSQALFNSVRNSLRRRLPTADEVVYEYSHSLVIGFSPTGQGIDSPLSLATRDGGLRLYFNQGPKLPDPKKILLGSASQVRYIWVESPKTLLRPEVKALVQATLEHSKKPFPSGGRGNLIIKTTAK